MGQFDKLERTWNLVPVLQILQKITENYCSCFYLSVGQVWWLHEYWFKRYIQKCTLSHVLILIMTSQILEIMGRLKIQKVEYLKNETIFLRNKRILNPCLRWNILRSYCFVAEVTFKKQTGFAYNSLETLIQSIQRWLNFYFNASFSDVPSFSKISQFPG